MMLLIILVSEAFKIACSPVLIMAIRTEGVQQHIVYKLIHDSLVFTLALSLCWFLVFVSALAAHGFDSEASLFIWKTVLGQRLFYGTLHHNISWAIVAWARYTKVMRHDLWMGADLVVWRKRLVALAWTSLVLAIFLPVTFLLIVSVTYGSYDPNSSSTDEVRTYTIVPIIFPLVSSSPWIITLIPYILMVRHVLKRQNSVGQEERSTSSREETVFGIYNPHALPVPQQAWAEPVNIPVPQSEEQDHGKILSTSITSLLVFFILGLPKILMPAYFVYGGLTLENFPQYWHFDVTFYIKISEDVLNTLFVVFNCRNLVHKLAIDVIEV